MNFKSWFCHRLTECPWGSILPRGDSSAFICKTDLRVSTLNSDWGPYVLSVWSMPRVSIRALGMCYFSVRQHLLNKTSETIRRPQLEIGASKFCIPKLGLSTEQYCEQQGCRIMGCMIHYHYTKCPCMKKVICQMKMVQVVWSSVIPVLIQSTSFKAHYYLFN